MSLSDRPVALVTGAATGVGRACALQFAQRGFAVIVNYSRSETEANRTASEIETLGTPVSVIQADVSVASEVHSMLDHVRNQYGRLDCLVNNAAATEFVEHSDLDAMTEDAWDRILGVNLKGPFFVTRAAAKLLAEGEGGSVVNISSVAGFTGAGSCIAYCASKGGLNTMTKSLARALGPKIRVNAVCPGPIDSRWIRDGNPDWDLNEMVANYPIPKPSQPDDIADAVLFFSTGTKLTTGQLLAVDGGQMLT
ncbi:SDR family NAD(P)-dependent oxidoreductase [Rhodopirellula sp. SWK7]|uniref:SDR family NAD(P)-dependent oxidoreductase n=1 Tax=Rhodopirellula sp. SWK7 TaxID=595460 RepID=UPI0002BE7418|nr:SDR family oxidoreductase [Rhodopirellula sp. SWK7]EMI46349.1 3-oxoacyl-[acyl-carrier-protein] reductase [Rhodopirellula sp. SWK7]